MPPMPSRIERCSEQTAGIGLVRKSLVHTEQGCASVWQDRRGVAGKLHTERKIGPVLEGAAPNPVQERSTDEATSACIIGNQALLITSVKGQASYSQ